jgi:predicted TIM-barrel fold metal-dependent hydrolase
MTTTGLFATAGKAREETTPYPIGYEDMRPGCYNAAERIADMDRAGILASMSFPSFPRFCGQVFYEGEDKELGLACVQAYNDWMIEEWCGTAPGRFIPLIIIPLWDPPQAAKEIERCAAKGVTAIAFSENPVPLGLPSIHDKHRYWDPVWAAVQDAGMIVCMHQGSSSYRARTSPDAPELVTLAWGIGNSMSGTMLDWLFGPVFVRYPGVKIALSEGGVGWIPYFLERAEQILDHQRHWLSSNLKVDLATLSFVQGESMAIDPMTMNVREVFREHIFGCFIDDVAGMRLLDLIGEDNVMIETDYPHSDTTWPDSIAFAHKHLEGLDDKTKHKILRGNAERLFRFTPAAPPT